MRYAMVALGWLLLVKPALAQVDSAARGAFGLEPGEYSVGFELLEEQDPSRAVTGVIPGATHPRPVRTYLWYPAERAADAQPMRFGRYASLANDDVWPAQIAGNLRERLPFSRGPLARSLGSAGFAALSERRVRAVENAEPLDGPFDLSAKTSQE
jgi:hypothetical protein